jgi:hypothetical protein
MDSETKQNINEMMDHLAFSLAIMREKGYTNDEIVGVVKTIITSLHEFIANILLQETNNED